MIVTCERCEQRYRIKADKLPSQGGKIRCPTCRHVFVVRPDAQDSPGSATTQKVATTDGLSGVLPSGPLPEPPASTQAAAKPSPKEKKAPAPASPEEAENKTWKLRVAGLTYAFQTLDSLQSWLLARDNVDTIKVGREGEPWAELGDYPEVMTLQLKTKFFSGGNGPTAGTPSTPSPESSASPDLSSPLLNSVARAQAVKPKPRARRAAQAAAARQQKAAAATSTRAGILIGLAFLLFLGAFVAHMTGLIDLGNVVPGMRTPTNEITQTKTPQTGGRATNEPTNTTNGNGSGGPGVVADDTPVDPPNLVDPVDEGPTEEEIFNETFKQAQPFVDEGRWAEARAYLEPWLAKRPDDMNLNTAMMKVYRGLGLSDKYETVKKKVTQLKKEASAREKEARAREKEK